LKNLSDHQEALSGLQSLARNASIVNGINSDLVWCIISLPLDFGFFPTSVLSHWASVNSNHLRDTLMSLVSSPPEQQVNPSLTANQLSIDNMLKHLSLWKNRENSRFLFEDSNFQHAVKRLIANYPHLANTPEASYLTEMCMNAQENDIEASLSVDDLVDPNSDRPQQRRRLKRRSQLKPTSEPGGGRGIRGLDD